MNIHILISIAVTSGGCAFEEVADGFEAPDDSGSTSTSDSDSGDTFAALELTEPSTFDVRVTDGDGQPLAFDPPRVEGGRAVLLVDADGAAALESLEVELSNFTLAKEKHGVTFEVNLTAAHLRTTAPAAIRPDRRGDQADPGGIATAELMLEWSLVGVDGVAHPLAGQRIPDVPIVVELAGGARDLSATIGTSVAGPVWDFGDVEVSDLSFALTARELSAGAAR